VEATVPAKLDIALAPERLDEGSPEESACFGLFTMRADSLSLTEGFDAFINGYRPGPLVSGYHVAEWFAWNWWRLRWEPRAASRDWWRAHKMSSIGAGYVWPNLTIFSDGLRTALISDPSSRPDAKPFRYVGAIPRVVPSSLFEEAVDAFIPQILGRLPDAGIGETNLDRVWRDVLEERSNPDTALRRKFEALLGCDADEADEAEVERLIADAEALGEGAMNEVAADYPHGGELLTADALRDIASHHGFDTSPRDVVRLAPRTAPRRSADVPAWRLGGAAARALREQQNLGFGPIGNDTLGRLSGVQAQMLTERSSGPSISFALDTGGATGRVVLRSKWETGRRFDLARLLGDRIVGSSGGKLFPATRAYTYRQKMQRSFAAELLAPFQALDDMLAGDYSAENQQDAADHFNVSELTIRTLLVNHRRLEREDLDGELEAAAA
jgi:hypothetical protein